MKLNLLKNHSRWIIGIFLFSLILILYLFVNKLSRPESNYNFLNTKKEKIYSGNTITQTFIPQNNNLNRIKIAFRSDGVNFGESIVLQIADSECQNVLRENKIIIPNFNLDPYYNFDFDVIPDSQNKRYCLKITYLKNDSSKDYKEVLTESRNIFGDGIFTNSKNQKISMEKSLVMRLSYKNNDNIENIKELMTRISQYKPWFLKNYFILTIIILFVTFSSVFAVLMILL